MFEDANGVLSDPMLTNKEDGDYVLRFKDNNLGKLNTLWLIDGVENPNKASFTNESEIHQMYVYGMKSTTKLKVEK